MAHVTAERKLLPVSELEKRIGYRFRDLSLLERAVTHRSFSCEHYERLEFLGDSVLGCVIAHALYKRNDRFDEGILTTVRSNIVCEKALTEIAKRIDVGSFVRLSVGEYRSGGTSKPSIIADVCEAIFGAVFLDGGFSEAERVVLGLYEPVLEGDHLDSSRMAKDPKSELQEILQSQSLPLPEYRLVSVSGQQHCQTFCCACKVYGLDEEFQAQGNSRKNAEKMAAQLAVAALRQLETRK